MMPMDGSSSFPGRPERENPQPVPAEKAAPAPKPEDKKFPKHVSGKKRPLWIRLVAWSFGALLALGFLLVIFRDVLVLQTVRRLGEAITGTAVELQAFQTSLSGMTVAIQDLSVENPPGYHSPTILELDRLYVDIDETTVLSDMIVVDNAELQGFHINYEKKYDGHNLDDLQDNIDDFVDAHGGYSEKNKDAKPGKSLLIRKLVVSGNSVTVINTETGQSVTLPMPNLTLENIGGPGCEASEVLNEVYERITDLVQGTLSNLGGQFSAAGAGVMDKIKNAGSAVLDSLTPGGDKDDSAKKSRKSSAEDSQDFSSKAAETLMEAGAKAKKGITSLWE